MEINSAIIAFAALAQPTRLDVFRLLVRHEPDGLPAGDIARVVAVPHNTLSTHLGILTRAGLVTSERQGRSIIYRARLDTVQALTGFMIKDCCGGRPELCTPLIADLTPCCTPKEAAMTDRVYNVLFLCTGNSARSILAESILRKDGAGRFRTFSAGSQPKGTVNPFALKVLERMNYPTDGLRSKNWGEFAGPDAPAMDFVITVCDNAAGEVCPVWPGQPISAHWGIEDPAAAGGTDLEKETAFVAAARFMKNRITAFINLPLASIDKLALGTHLREIGRQAGATTRLHEAG